MNLFNYIRSIFLKRDEVKNPNSISQNIPSSIDITAGQVKIGFSKNQGSGELVLDLINNAKTSIHLAAYGFNHIQIINALISAYTRGVDVKIVLDKSDAENTSKDAVKTMYEQKIPIRIDSLYAIMHNKFMIVDGITVETGSFNYTQNAQCHNAENVLILVNQPAVAQRYEQRWQELWNESKDFIG